MGLINLLFGSSAQLKAASDFNPQGTGGTQTIGKFLLSSEKNAAMASPHARAKKYDEIALNVAIVATGLRYFSSLISSIDWTATPKKVGDKIAPEAKKYADLTTQLMHAMDTPWYKVVRYAGQFKWVGFSIQEMVAARMDHIAPGLIGIGSVEPRPQISIEGWELEPKSNKVISWDQRDPNGSEIFPLDRDRCIYLTDDTLTTSPDGVGLLRHVIFLCDQLRKLEQLEGWAFETDLRGVPIGSAPTAILNDMVSKNRITSAKRDEMLSGLTDFITNHMRNPELGLLLDSSVYSTQDAARTPSTAKMWGLELVKGNGTGLAELAAAIARKQHEIARALGIEQFMLGSGPGSHALSEDKTRNLLELVNATVMEIASGLEKDFVRKIFELNNWPIQHMPTLTPDAVAIRSVTVIVECLSKMSLAGAVLDRNDPVINQVRTLLNLVDQPFVTDAMKAETKPANSGGTPGVKSPGKAEPKTPVEAK